MYAAISAGKSSTTPNPPKIVLQPLGPTAATDEQGHFYLARP